MASWTPRIRDPNFKRSEITVAVEAHRFVDYFKFF